MQERALREGVTLRESVTDWQEFHEGYMRVGVDNVGLLNRVDLTWRDL